MNWPIPTTWTPERIEQVRTMAANNFSASQIAAELGNVTRNAVIGIGFRKNIPFHSGNAVIAKKVKAVPVPRPPRAFIPKVPIETEPEEPTVPDIAVPEMLMLTFEELKPGDCRYPLGNSDFRFCGLPARENGPYCSGHHAVCIQLAYQLPERRR